MSPVLEAARGLLADCTPLRTDCGRLCGAACCASLEGEETGMLLFPGEEEACGDQPGFSLRRTAGGSLLVCSGSCDRAARPLACRLFPLLPLLRNGEIRVETDLRAKTVCPLARQRLDALGQDYVEAVRRCGETLAADAVQRAFLLRLTEEQDALRALRKQFRGE